MHKLTLADVSTAIVIGELHGVEVRLKHAEGAVVNLYDLFLGLKMSTY